MNRLVKRLFVALLLVLAVLLPSSWALRVATDRVLASPVFVVQSGVDTLFVGDSHIEVGLNPRDWPGSANFAKSGENYFFTYYKLRHILARNPKIEKLVLGCSWHNFSKSYEDPFLTGDKASAKQDYFLFLDDEGQTQLRRWNPDFVVPYLTYKVGIPLGIYKNLALQRSLLRRPIRADDLIIVGGYKGTSISRITEEGIREKLAEYFGEPESNPQISPTMVTYLHRIIELCRERSIPIALLNTPLHPLFRAGVPRRFKETVSEVMAASARKRGVRYIDVSELDLPSSSFQDGDHLNAAGVAATRLVLGDRPW